MTIPIGLVALYLAVPAWGQPARENPQEVFDRAAADFQAGRIRQSVAGFDRVASLVPNYAPQLWQRGIALYYVGRFKDCRAQFESHRTVNPDDVENAAWHFLCAARAESAERAKASLLPVGPDPRKPMREIYQMLRGDLTPDQVIAAANSGDDAAKFYAHLYAGLYYEAIGDAKHALAHITAAADARYAAAGYMQAVARVHRDLRMRQK